MAVKEVVSVIQCAPTLATAVQTSISIVYIHLEIPLVQVKIVI